MNTVLNVSQNGLVTLEAEVQMDLVIQLKAQAGYRSSIMNRIIEDGKTYGS